MAHICRVPKGSTISTVPYGVTTELRFCQMEGLSRLFSQNGRVLSQGPMD